MLKGIAASAGVSVAKAYKLEAPVVVIEKKMGFLQRKSKNSIMPWKKRSKISKVLKSGPQNV